MNKRRFSLGDILRKLNQEKNEFNTNEESLEKSFNNNTELSSGLSVNQDIITKQPLYQTNNTFQESHLPDQPAIGEHPSENQKNNNNNLHSTNLTEKSIPISELDHIHHKQNITTTIHPDHTKPSNLSGKVNTSHHPSSHISKDSLPSPQTNSFSKFEGDDEDEEETFDLLKYISIIIRRRYIITAITLIAALFSIYRYSTSDKYYIATARLLFSPNSQDLTGDQRFYTYWGDREKQFNTHLELLKSPSVLKMVAENLGDSISYSVIASGLSIRQGETNGEKNDIIELSFKNSNSERAQDILNELCRSYIDYRRDVNSQELSRLVFKFETQINKLQNELDIKENNLRKFKEENQLVHLSNEANTTVSKLTDMELALQKTNLDLIESKDRLTSLNSQIGNQELEVVQSKTFQDPLQNRLSELELELNTLSAEYNSEHFKVKTLKQQIELLKSAAIETISREAASKTFVKNPIRQSLLQEYINLSIEKSALEAKRIAQEKIIELLNHDLLNLPLLQQKHAFLQRETESQLQTLRLLKNKYEETKIKRDSQESDLKLLEMAETPHSAIRKVKSSTILVGILAGLLLGIALAFLIEYFDQSLKDPLEVEKSLEIPLLGIVPFIEADKELFEQKDLTKNIFEPFRALRANLKHIASAHKLKTFIICSAVKGEGKTTLSANLSITFALDGKKIILIDADLRRSQMHTLFSIPKKTGLADYLLGAATIDEIIKPTKYENLFIITSGERPHNPAELLGTWRFDKLLEELRDRGDFIIFDSPALLPVSDTITMAPKMDGCLIVVRTLWTPVKAAKQAKNQLKRIGCNIFGGILNGVTHSKGYYPYYYGYYGYYSYKYSYEEDKNKTSFREFGLHLEQWIKSNIKTFWYEIPKYVAQFVSFVQFSISKPLMWVLIILISILVAIQIVIESRFQPDYGDSIQYIGLGTSSSKENDSLMVFNDIAGFSRESSVSLNSNDSNFIIKNGLQDSLKIWLLYKQTNNIEELLSFYDDSFKFQDGTLSDWKEQLTRETKADFDNKITFNLKNLRENKYGKDYIDINVAIEEISLTGSSQKDLRMIWQKNEYGWKIIRESQMNKRFR